MPATLPNPPFNIKDNALAQLASGIDAAVTSFTVNAGAGALFPSSNFIVFCEYERILVGSRSGDTFSSLTRGYNGAAAAFDRYFRRFMPGQAQRSAA